MKGKLQENLRTYADQALMSKQLATIILDVPVEFNEEELVMKNPTRKSLQRSSQNWNSGSWVNVSWATVTR